MPKIIITHILPTKTAFAVTNTHPAEAVFIPGKIASMHSLVEGQEVEALLVPNNHQPERTPWLAARIELLPPASNLRPAPDPEPDPEPSLEDRVLEVLREGGEWTDFEMAEYLPFKTEKYLSADPREVSEALETIYNKDLCSKYQLWRKRSDAEPSDEWFTCYPDEVDFVTGVE
jgi:hypothetical protein